MSVMDWREYQERVADLFRELGCSAEVEASVEGARSTHDIDVWVVCEGFGLKHKWAVECKNWRAAIPKEKVLTLRQVVEDVGADKGILVAESGFQPGAVSAAASTNVLLTTLVDLRTLANNDLQAAALENLGKRVFALRERHHDLYTHEGNGLGGSISTARPGVDGANYITMSGILGSVESGLERARMGRFPAPAGVNLDVDRYEMARSLEEFIQMSKRTIEEVDAWITTQEAAIESSA